MRRHSWKRTGNKTGSDHFSEFEWHCHKCDAKEYSILKPWNRIEESDLIYITSVVCGGGPANVPILADCELEAIRQIMIS